jgi:hypothetical protein
MTINWWVQVQTGRGIIDPHRAIAVARTLADSGRWDGTGRIIIHDPLEAHRKMSGDGANLVEGPEGDFEIAGRL